MKVSITPLALVAATMLSGCASSNNFSRAMEEPIRLVGNVSSVAREAHDDVTVLHAVGLVRDKLLPKMELAWLVCKTDRGTAAVNRTLSVFNDGLEIVQDIGAAPSDTSYAGYIRQLKKQRDFLNTPDQKPEQIEAALETKLTEQRKRCEGLLEADRDAGTFVSSKAANTRASTVPFLGLLLSIDQFAKALLGTGEKLQREAAVRLALAHVSKQFKAAERTLRLPPDESFGPFVQFPETASEVAQSANSTSLGATLTLRRWTVARHLQQQWTALSPCRSTPEINCLGDADKLAIANAFSSNARRYFALAQMDPNKALTGIKRAADAAEEAQKINGIGGILDALTGIAGGLSDFNDVYQGFENSR